MGLLDGLKIPTLAEGRQLRPVRQKWDMDGRVAEKAAAIVDEKKLERACLKIVWKRDKGQCRKCGCKVQKSLERTPTRGETHHLAGRADYAVKYDSRNRILVCALCHEKLELLKLFIVATARQMFTVNGKRYVNGDCPIKFQEAA